MSERSNAHNFTNELASKYTALFNVYRDEKLADLSLPFIAIYHRRDEHYMVAKRFKVYGVENQQIVFTKSYDEISIEKVQKFQQAIEENITNYIPENQDHMSTTVLGIIVTDKRVDEKVIKEVKRYRKIKFLKFGLHGWIEMFMVLIDLSQQSIHVHSKGKSFVKSIQKILEEEKVTR